MLVAVEMHRDSADRLVRQLFASACSNRWISADFYGLLESVSSARARKSAWLATDSGGGGIRTHEALARPTTFKAVAFDRSPPRLEAV